MERSGLQAANEPQVCMCEQVKAGKGNLLIDTMIVIYAIIVQLRVFVVMQVPDLGFRGTEEITEVDHGLYHTLGIFQASKGHAKPWTLPGPCTLAFLGVPNY